MRKFMKILCLILALVFVLSACGGGETEKQGEGNTDDTNEGANKGENNEGAGGENNEGNTEEANPDAGLTLDKTEAALKIGESVTLVATFVPSFESDDKTITLESSDTAVATVEGMTVTAVAAGTVTVTAKNADGKFTATCTVTVSSDKKVYTIEYDGKSIGSKDVTDDPNQSVALVLGTSFTSGKKIKITMPEGEKYLAVTIGNGVKEAIVYVPDGVYEYTVPSGLNAIFPSNFATGAKMTVRIPTAQELITRRNLALNPYDSTATSTKSYPHVICNNQYNTTEFGARCAIDGFTTNTGHGYYPQQSWGPKDVVKATDHFTIDFGRSVLVNEIVIYLRGDFGHDAYFSTIVVQFSDGSSEVIKPTRTRDGQKFTFSAKETTSVKLTGFVTDTSKGGPWTGLAEVEVYGLEKLG